jgi:hypothetical protein
MDSVSCVLRYIDPETPGNKNNPAHHTVCECSAELHPAVQGERWCAVPTEHWTASSTLPLTLFLTLPHEISVFSELLLELLLELLVVILQTVYICHPMRVALP